MRDLFLAGMCLGACAGFLTGSGLIVALWAAHERRQARRDAS